MLLARGELWVLAGASGLDGRRNRDGVLTGINNTRDTTDGVGVALAYAAAPEGVVRAVGQRGAGIQAGEREEAWIPTAADDADGAGLTGRGVHVGKVSGDVGVRVKAVHHGEELGQLWGLLGQVGGAAAADDDDVNLIGHLGHLAPGIHGRVSCDLHACGVATGEDGNKVHVGGVSDGGLYTATKVAVSCDGNVHGNLPLGGKVNRRRIMHGLLRFLSRNRTGGAS